MKQEEKTLLSKSKILAAAGEVFAQKGYDMATMQDITEKCGLSKGAIYHHFKSKEDILVAVSDKMTEESNKMLEDIRDRTDLNGKNKLKMIFKKSILRPVQDDIFTVAPNLKKSPRLLFSIFSETMNEAAPKYILPIIEQGVADGTIQTDYPAELAQLIILVANIWTNPMIFDDAPDVSYRKFMVYRQMMQGFGLDIVDDEMMSRIQELAVVYQKNK